MSEEKITIDMLARYRAEPDDTIVLRVDEPLTRDRIEHLQVTAAEAFPGQRVLVLDPGMSLEVVSAA